MDPKAEYAARRKRHCDEEQILHKRSNAIGNWRLVIGVAALALAWLVFGTQSVSPWFLLIPVVAFTGLAIWHGRVMRRRSIAESGVAYYDGALERLDGRWAGKGSSGERYRDAQHVYADDLDLFGNGGLFELVARTRTAAGEEMLAGWLLRPAEREEVLERQEAVTELRPHLDLQEDIALLAQDVRPDIEMKSLAEWGVAPRVHFPALLRPLALVLAVCGVAAVVGFFTGRVPLWAVAAILGCDYLLIFSLRAKVHAVLSSVEASGRHLRLLSSLIERLQREEFTSRRLNHLRSTLEIAGETAFRRITKLGKLIDWLDSSDHVFVRILRPVLLWQEQLAISFEQWRRDSGPQIGPWVQAVAECEALLSFATLAYERPHWTTPVLNDASSAQLEAEGLKHPLLGEASAVANDVRLDDKQRMVVVSGSNMSGKSTLLRATGLNAVLAWAGAPVAARSLQVSRLYVGASIRVNDSLQDNRSRFFAEISRLRQIVDLTKKSRPVLFLLEELLSGTNSHDRRIGAAGIVREMLRANTVGLLTTHDLALTNMEQDVIVPLVNMHFEDQMNGPEMVFDYQLKPGVVTRSNALELMRAVGLEV